MEIQLTRNFVKQFRSLPQFIQDRSIEALDMLRASPHHPSLHNKKMAGYAHIYEIRVNINYRITYQKTGDLAILRKIGTHDLLRNP